MLLLNFLQKISFIFILFRMTTPTLRVEPTFGMVIQLFIAIPIMGKGPKTEFSFNSRTLFQFQDSFQ